MRIEFENLSQIKTVIKPWGYEKWIQAGSKVYPFVLKELLLKQNQRTSLQVHRIKSETIYIQSGHGKIYTYPKEFDCERYLNGEYSSEEIANILDGLISVEIGPHSIFHTPPNTIHRMVAITDLLYIEASTTELDDVIRIQDDSQRIHGRIESEHK